MADSVVEGAKVAAPIGEGIFLTVGDTAADVYSIEKGVITGDVEEVAWGVAGLAIPVLSGTVLKGGVKSIGNGIDAAKGADKAGDAAKGAKPPSHTPEGAGRKGAHNQAKRDNDIPTSKQPDRVTPNTDKRGNNQPGRTYEYDTPAAGGGTKTTRIRDDSAGHQYPDNPSQNRGPHLNDGTGRHYDY